MGKHHQKSTFWTKIIKNRFFLAKVIKGTHIRNFGVKSLKIDFVNQNGQTSLKIDIFDQNRLF